MTPQTEERSPRWTAAAGVVATVVFFAVLLGEGVHCFRSAHASLDSLVYVAIAEAGGSGQNLLPQAGQECLAELPATGSGCAELTAHGEVFHLAEAFSPQAWAGYTRLYRVKPLFCWTMTRLHERAHVEGLLAERWVCAGSFVLVGLVLWLWLRETVPAAVAAAAALLIMSQAQVVRLGQSLTPDGFACFFLLLGVYLVLYRRQVAAAAAVAVLLVLARPENALFVLLFAAMALYRSERPARQRRLWMAAVVAGVGALQVAMGRFTHPVPWPVFFKTSFVQLLMPWEYASARLSVGEYARALLVTGADSAAQYLPLPIFLGGVALLQRRCPPELRDLLWVCAAATVLRFLLYPTMDERFYTPYLIVTFAAAVVAAAQSGPGWMRLPERSGSVAV